MIAFGIIVSITTLIYFFFLLLMAVSWANAKGYKAVPFEPIGVSIIIPCRNEENNIAACLNSLQSQNYPRELIEIILVDDHSEDGTLNRARSFLNINILALNEFVKGKKSALSLGIKHATHELLITRDADTVADKEWLTTIVSCYLRDKPSLIICPVSLHKDTGLANSLQRLEHYALTLLTGGTALMNKPIMCNGANLCFTKSVFNLVGGYEGNDNIASGDDIFLLNKITRLKPHKITYLKSLIASVTTFVPSKLTDVFHQRLRWAQKSRNNDNLLNGFSGFLISGTTILFLFLGVLSAFYTELTPYFIFTAILKCFIDFLLLFLAASFYKEWKALLAFPVMVVCYPVYVASIAVAVFTTRAKWKGRSIK